MNTATVQADRLASSNAEKGRQAKVFFQPEQYAAVGEIATTEQRSFANAVRKLVGEALAARQKAAEQATAS